jgi:hypothetical protein
MYAEGSDNRSKCWKITNSTMIWDVNMKAMGSSETSVNIPQAILLEANDL